MVNIEETLLHSPATLPEDDILCIIDNLPIAVVVLDADRKLILANKMAGRFVNRDDSQLIGLLCGDALGCIYHKDAPEGCGSGTACIQCKLRTTVMDTFENDKGYFMVETTMTLNSIGPRHLRITTQPLNLQKGKAVLVSIEDITEAKKYEQTKLDKEKLTAVLQTAGAICHEINQPLMAILGFSELLLDDAIHGQLNEDNVKEIKEQADRLAKITSKLMDITKYRTKKYLRSQILDIDAASSGTDPDPNR
nr:histidine kinase dimerization/phospho-acceptor domain-containing protein [uncultured Desulfobacter sp.]